MSNKVSLIALIASCAFIFTVSFAYYPKWKMSGTEATLSWDVSGYYLYLPAIFIYHDLKGLDFLEQVLNKYHSTPDPQQAFRHNSGNYVMKYPIGQAFAYFPFFAAAHLIAISSDYAPDGFSAPYQFMISLGSLLYALLGLYLLRKILLEYFDDKVVAWVIAAVVFGTNYLNYSAIDGAMTHNTLFTVYCLLIFFTIKFYKMPDVSKAAAIGLLVGFAAIVRPTEILSGTIPMLWGLSNPIVESIRGRMTFFREHLLKVATAIFSVFLVGSVQLIYWKCVSGDWIVYSYQDQGFSWLNPHIINGLFSYKCGWLIYTPLMIFALIGFFPLYFKRNYLFWTTSIFICLFVYIAFAWDIWWYGGSLGQRTMVQSYPLLAIPLAMFFDFVRGKKVLAWITLFLSMIFVCYNLWLTHQAHLGGLFYPEQMTRAYFWKTIGTFEKDKNDLKLLDTKEEFTGIRRNVSIIYENGFEGDTSRVSCEIPPIEGLKSLCLNAHHQYSDTYFIPSEKVNADWIRVSATFRCSQKEWNVWRMTQFIVKFFEDEKTVRQRMIRVYRLLEDGETQSIYFDMRVPKGSFDRVGVLFWNADGDKTIRIDDLKVEKFTE